MAGLLTFLSMLGIWLWIAISITRSKEEKVTEDVAGGFWILTAIMAVITGIGVCLMAASDA